MDSPSEDGDDVAAEARKSTTTSITTSLSASQLRERRRQKVLGNKTSRMEKILNVSSSSSSSMIDDNNGGEASPSKRKVREEVNNEFYDDEYHLPGRTSFIAGTTGDNDAEVLMNSIKNLLQGVKGEGEPLLEKEEEKETSPTITKRIPPSSGKRVTFSNEEPETFEFPSSSSFPPQTPAGFLVTQNDGSTLHPKLSNTTCRVLIALLGMFLSLFNAKFVIITFLSWEAAVYFINGFPNDDQTANTASSSGLVLLFTILGMRGRQVQRINFVLKISSCLITDFSILAVCVILAKVLAASLAASR